MIMMILTLLLATVAFSHQQQVKMYLCPAELGGCKEDNDACTTFITPLNTCYSGSMFPSNPSLAEFDTLDKIENNIVMRSFFSSTDGTCTVNQTGQADATIQLLIGECMGPLGDEGEQSLALFTLWGSSDEL